MGPGFLPVGLREISRRPVPSGHTATRASYADVPPSRAILPAMQVAGLRQAAPHPRSRRRELCRVHLRGRRRRRQVLVGGRPAADRHRCSGVLHWLRDHLPSDSCWSLGIVLSPRHPTAESDLRVTWIVGADVLNSDPQQPDSRRSSNWRKCSLDGIGSLSVAEFAPQATAGRTPLSHASEGAREGPGPWAQSAPVNPTNVRICRDERGPHGGCSGCRAAGRRRARSRQMAQCRVAMQATWSQPVARKWSCSRTTSPAGAKRPRRPWAASTRRACRMVEHRLPASPTDGPPNGMPAR